MFYFAHQSGVFDEFSYEVIQFKEHNPKKHMYEAVEHVFEEFITKGLIQSDLYLFI